MGGHKRSEEASLLFCWNTKAGIPEIKSSSNLPECITHTPRICSKNKIFILFQDKWELSQEQKDQLRESWRALQVGIFFEKTFNSFLQNLPFFYRPTLSRWARWPSCRCSRPTLRRWSPSSRRSTPYRSWSWMSGEIMSFFCGKFLGSINLWIRK